MATKKTPTTRIIILPLILLILASTLPTAHNAYAESIEKEKEYYDSLRIINRTLNTVTDARDQLDENPQQASQLIDNATADLQHALDLIKEVLQAEGKDYEALKQEILSGNKKYSLEQYYIAIAKTGIYVEEALGNLTEAKNSISQGDKIKAQSDLTNTLATLRSAYDLGMATYNTAIANRESPTRELIIIGLVLVSLGLYFVAAHKYERRPTQ